MRPTPTLQPPGLPASLPTDAGSFDAAAAAGKPVAVLQLYGAVEDAEAIATAAEYEALEAVLEAASSPGSVLCAQPLKLSPEGAKE